MRSIYKWYSAAFIQPYVRKRMQRSSIYKWKGIRLFIPAGVFHPAYFRSTHILMRFMETKAVAGKSVLELGAGNGLISIALAQKGAVVTATDINQKALSALEENAKANNVVITTLYSDLFRELTVRSFDHIVINPPFYPKEARNDLEKAWFCGENYAYFNYLFEQLPIFMQAQTAVWMILSEDTATAHIEDIAAIKGLRMEIVYKERKFWEWNYIYSIEKA